MAQDDEEVKNVTDVDGMLGLPGYQGGTVAGEWFTLKDAFKRFKPRLVKMATGAQKQHIQTSYVILVGAAHFGMLPRDSPDEMFQTAFDILLLWQKYPIAIFEGGALNDYKTEVKEIQFPTGFTSLAAAIKDFTEGLVTGGGGGKSVTSVEAVSGGMKDTLLDKMKNTFKSSPKDQARFNDHMLEFIVEKPHDKAVFCLHYLRLVTAKADGLSRYYLGTQGRSMFGRVGIPHMEGHPDGMSALEVFVKGQYKECLAWLYAASILDEGGSRSVYYTWFGNRLEFAGLSCVTALSSLNIHSSGNAAKYLMEITADGTVSESLHIAMTAALYASDGRSSDELGVQFGELKRRTIGELVVTKDDCKVGRICRMFDPKFLHWAGFFSKGITSNRIHGAIKCCQSPDKWVDLIKQCDQKGSLMMEMFVGADVWLLFLDKVSRTNVASDRLLAKAITSAHGKVQKMSKDGTSAKASIENPAPRLSLMDSPRALSSDEAEERAARQKHTNAFE